VKQGFSKLKFSDKNFRFFFVGYIKGGWNFRKALKNYEKTHEKLREMMKQAEIVTSTGSSSESDKKNSKKVFFRSSPHKSVATISADKTEQKELMRLNGSASFGHGAFNLVLSFIPPKYLKLATLVGFNGDRNVGISSLRQAYESNDMKSYLAMLTLLWYYCLVLPFFAFDEDNLSITLKAKKIIEENESKFSDSALFLFFKSRVYRFEKNLQHAIETLVKANEPSTIQFEVKILCVYELGWCYILQLQWEKALLHIKSLKKNSVWILSYYCYLTALLYGVNCELETCKKLMEKVPEIIKRKNNPVESYIVRKSKNWIASDKSHETSLILLLEVMYLWNTLQDCSEEKLRLLLIECQNVSNPQLNAIKYLVLGGIYKCLKEIETSLLYFQQAAQLALEDISNDSHITPFAYFEISLIYLQSNSKKGKEHLEETATFSGYDLEERLRMRIHSTKRKYQLI